MTRKTNKLSHRRGPIRRPKVCRTKRTGKVIGYGMWPPIHLTPAEEEAYRALPVFDGPPH
jgi:hypothetical protein